MGVEPNNQEGPGYWDLGRVLVLIKTTCFVPENRSNVRVVHGSKPRLQENSGAAYIIRKFPLTHNNETHRKRKEGVQGLRDNTRLHCTTVVCVCNYVRVCVQRECISVCVSVCVCKCVCV